ncbi:MULTISPECIES: SDR family NAD(P)-dependent oxidoreductase [unclassified Arthrobacter]|uniref:SDR family NAD(P)-dependent oxidoreductase n=1 Tax=unclassified Arthrobacter TaxID=235627 RepID=UPI002E05BD9E|nr:MULTISPECIES: SDR family NAD(P)-dependent oxidoreductase [unclassified Arthrobacter]MEC5192880.1 NAD(P)-dependent dehydrogenase (short-subunit alcohol dehydrogenase family) [Arthrobacter sp. MP_M4]MEC5204361.1 NAD(P)-dependent dehydrogenase (short-subunit alcohol dehydrogenase family) [Arthrobacter sp. MP_M7]
MSDEKKMTPQHKIGSGFGRDSTAADVIAGIDLHGKTAVVTGGYSGLGLETVRALASAGAAIVVPARRPDHAREVLAAAGLAPGVPGGDVSVAAMDLADQASVKAFAAGFLASDLLGASGSLDLLINNAAIMASPEQRVGPGWESQFATNHLGHFALANLLWPALAAGSGARVVALSSTGHKLSPVRFNDINFESGYDKWQAYGQAKTANSLFAVQLDALGKNSGVRAFAVHPGGIMTELQRHLPREEMIASGWMDEAGNVDARFKTPAQGAATSVWAATSPALHGMGGVYCEDCDVAEPTVVGSPEARVRGVDAHAVDRADAARLWTLSAELTGIDAFGS